MTDEQIKKASECYKIGNCDDCPLLKAEIERLNAVSEICGECHKKYAEKIERAKSDAIKEFAERLKTYAKELQIGDNISWVILGVGRVDQLVKEMTEQEC